MNLPPGIEIVPGTDFWVVEGDTHLGLWARQHGHIVTDPNLFNFLRPYVKDCKVVWDLGANIGDHTRQYLDWGMQVVAFEPHPVTFKCLEHNCPEARCINVAASNEAGSLNFKSLDNVGASRVHKDGEWQIPAVALDDIPDLPPPDFVKIDIEGFEPFALSGMEGVITRHKPIIFIEMNRGALAANGASPEGLHDAIRSLGYYNFHLYPRRASWVWEQFDCIYLPT